MIQTTLCWMGVGLAIAASISPVAAQIVPDETLGDERSQVRPDERFTDVDRIDGGAIRGQNLFHSFEQFNVGSDEFIYFGNPTGIENILSRVTGRDPSNILGRLGVFGSANLFLMNPNGIVFGENANLDISGSFVATTANAIEFGDRGFFSASNPQLPSSLLTVNPDAFLFNQLPVGNIAVNPSATLITEADRSLLLVGGDVTVNGATLWPQGGLLEIGGLAAVGRVGLTQVDDGFSLLFPADVAQSNISITNQARIFGSDAGEVRLQGSEISIDNARTFTDEATEFSLQADRLNFNNAVIISQDGAQMQLRGGDIAIDNSNIFALDGTGITVQGDRVVLTNSLMGTNTRTTQAAGNIQIQVDRLQLRGNSQISSLTAGAGSSGDIQIQASDAVDLSTEGDASILTSSVRRTSGNAGDVSLETGRLRLQSLSNSSSALISTSTDGATSSAGAVTIRATDSITVTGRAAAIRVSGSRDRNTGEQGSGGLGDISIDTRRLTLRDGGLISMQVAGGGDGGDIVVRASDSIQISGISQPIDRTGNGFTPSGIGNDTSLGATGNSGNITIETDRLSVRNGGDISASNVNADGQAGNITIRANRVEVIGWIALNPTIDTIIENQNIRFSDSISQISTETSGTNANAIGGTLRIETDRLIVRDGASVSATTRGRGDAGDVIIEANRIDLSGTGPRRRGGFAAAGIFSEAQTRRGDSSNSGDGGNITIDTNLLRLSDGARISTTTFVEADAGNIQIQAADVQLNNGSIFSNVEPNGIGEAGDILVETDRLTARNGGQIAAATRGNGNAGDITIQANQIDLSGVAPDDTSSGFFSVVERGAIGQGGNITVQTTSLNLSDRAIISARSRGRGDAGDVAIEANGAVSLTERSRISTAASRETGGDISIRADSLDLSDRARITAESSGRGNAGNIAIETSETVTAIDSRITTEADRASGGDIRVNTGDIRLRNSDVVTRVNQSGNGGDINLSADSVIAFGDSDILTFAPAGRGGNITFDTPAFFGQDYQPADASTDPETLQGNDRVDVNANGIVAGVITVPDVSLVQNSLADLPEAAIDTDQLLANSCIVRGNSVRGDSVRGDRPRASFAITGAGNLPVRPGDAASAYPTGTVRPIPPQSDRTGNPGDPIVEPQNLYRLPDGRIVLSRDCRDR